MQLSAIWAILQVLQLLAEHLAQWSCSVAFPELSHLTLLQLKVHLLCTWTSSSRPWQPLRSSDSGCLSVGQSLCSSADT